MQLHPSLSILDSSKLQDYLTCPRQFFYRHVLGWRPSGPQFDLVFGEAMHAALEQLYRYGFGNAYGPEHTATVQQLAYASFLNCYREQFDEETDDDHPAKNPYSASEVIEGYCIQYANEFDRYEVLEVSGEKCVEVSGFAPISQSQRIYFRQDCILQDRTTGQIFTLEHKTASRGGRMWEAQWDLSIQVGTYTHALYSLFDPAKVFGVRVNGLIFLKRTQEFVRVPCEKTYPQMQVWHQMVQDWSWNLQRDLDSVQAETNAPPDNVMFAFALNPLSCTKWNRLCPYHDFCLSWPNPLQRCDEVPLGFVQEYWDPQERERKRRVATEHERSVQESNQPDKEGD